MSNGGCIGYSCAWQLPSEVRCLLWQEKHRLARHVLGARFVTMPLCSAGEFVAFAKYLSFLSTGTFWMNGKQDFARSVRGEGRG